MHLTLKLVHAVGLYDARLPSLFQAVSGIAVASCTSVDYFSKFFLQFKLSTDFIQNNLPAIFCPAAHSTLARISTFYAIGHARLMRTLTTPCR